MIFILILLLILSFNDYILSSISKKGTNNIKSGFGNKITTTNNQNNIPSSLELEKNIQLKITSNKELSNIMKLQQEIEDFNKLTLNMSDLEKTLISQEKLNIINSKNEQLEKLRKEGWSKQEVLSKLLEITWDVSADFRDNRHQNKEVSKELNDFMLYLAKIILIKDNNILDVGCGDGILIKYLNMIKNDHLINNRITGIDLSENLINYAIKNYPQAKFYKMNFLDFKSPSTEKYSTIVFNECLHNFLNLTDTLKYASNILDNQGQIIVSHPRGYDNIFNQYNKNRWLVPSLLPKNDIEWNNILKDTNLKLIKNKLPSNSKSYLYILEHNN